MITLEQVKSKILKGLAQNEARINTALIKHDEMTSMYQVLEANWSDEGMKYENEIMRQKQIIASLREEIEHLRRGVAK